MLSNRDKEIIVACYTECVTEEERQDTVVALATEFDTNTMEIRQALQAEGAYKKVEGNTEKQQYARALYAVTLISEKEWMKLTLKSQKKLMQVFKRGSHDNRT